MSKLATLEQGAASPHGELAPPTRGSMSGASGPLWKHYHRLIEGGVVLYKPNLTVQDVLDAPMCDATLSPGTCERFDRSLVYPALAAGLSGWDAATGYSLTRSLADAQFSGLDMVSVDIYTAWWRATGRAHIGVRHGDYIEFDDATAPIFYPPEGLEREHMEPRWWDDSLWTCPLLQGVDR